MKEKHTQRLSNSGLTLFNSTQEIKKTSNEENLAHIITAAKTAITSYSNSVTHDTRRKKGKFYKYMINLPTLTPLTEAIIIYTLFFVQKGKKLNRLIIKNIPQTVFQSMGETSQSIFKNNTDYLNMIVHVYGCSKTDIIQSATEIYSLTQRVDIKNQLEKSFVLRNHSIQAYVEREEANTQLIVTLKGAVDKIQSSLFESIENTANGKENSMSLML